MFFAVAYAASWLLADTTGGATQRFVDLWDNWDARIFVGIAERGYTDAADPHSTAFFPLFPLAVAAVTLVVRNAVVAGLVVSTVATVVAATFLYRLADDEIGPPAGRRAVLYLVLFPTAVFLVAPYSEALFLAGAIPAFYYARRGRWRLVGIPVAVAMGARFAGIFVLVGLAVEWLGRRERGRGRGALAAFGIGVAPLIGYCLYLWSERGDPFYFVVDQREGWGRTLTNPLTALERTWDTWGGADYPTNFIFAWRIEVVAAAVAIGFVAWAVAKREWGYAAFMGSLTATLLVSTWYYSIPRMLLMMFPVAVFAAEATRRRDGAHETMLVVLAPLAALGVIVFTQHAWFY